MSERPESSESVLTDIYGVCEMEPIRSISTDHEENSDDNDEQRDDVSSLGVLSNKNSITGSVTSEVMEPKNSQGVTFSQGSDNQKKKMLRARSQSETDANISSMRLSQRKSFLGTLQNQASTIRQSLSAIPSNTFNVSALVKDQFGQTLSQRSGELTEQNSEAGERGEPPRRTSRRSFLVNDVANEPMIQRLEAAGFRHSVASEAMMLPDSPSMSRCQLIRKHMKMARLHLWLFFEEPWYTKKACLVSSIMVMIIIASVGHSVVSSQGYSDDGNKQGWASEEWPGIAFNVIFCVDLLVRFWAFPQRCSFLRTPKNTVDFLSVLPFLLNEAFGLPKHVEPMDFLRWLNAYEAFLRLVKLSRYFWGWQLLFRAVCDSIKALVIPVYFLLIMVFFGSCTLYVFENIEESNQVDTGFLDISESNLYRRSELGMVTIRTLSDAIHFSTICILSMSAGAHYGLQAASTMGQVTAGCLMSFGMLFMAMPIAIVGSVFSQTWFDQDRIVLLEKVRSRLRAQGYKWDDCEEVFDEVDKDHSGEIDFHEFKKMLKSFHIESLSRAKCQRLYRYFDLDGDGAINYYDFAGTLFPEMPLETNEDDEDSDTSSECSEEYSTRDSISAQSTHLRQSDQSACTFQPKLSQNTSNDGNWTIKKSQKGKHENVMTAVLGVIQSLSGSANPSRSGSVAHSRRGSVHAVNGHRGGSMKRGSAEAMVQDCDSTKSTCGDRGSLSSAGGISQRGARTMSGEYNRGSLNSNGSMTYDVDPLAALTPEDRQSTERKSLESNISHMPRGASKETQSTRFNELFTYQLESIINRMDSNITRLLRMTEKRNMEENHQPQVVSVFGPAMSNRGMLSGAPSRQESHSRRHSLSIHPERGPPPKVLGSRRPSVLGAQGARESCASATAAVSARRPSIQSQPRSFGLGAPPVSGSGTSQPFNIFGPFGGGSYRSEGNA